MARKTILSIGKYGDITVGWEEADDTTVLPIVQQLIDKGWRFFILESGNQIDVTSIDQVSARSIVIPEESLELLHQSGVLAVGAKIVGEIVNTGEIAKTAEAVAAADTVAVPPAQGG